MRTYERYRDLSAWSLWLEHERVKERLKWEVEHACIHVDSIQPILQRSKLGKA